MTSAHTIDLPLAASPEVVYAEVATPAGLRRWWTDGADGSTEVGSTFRLTFHEGHWTDMRIDELIPGRAVRWTCVAQHEPNMDPTDEWVGTTVSFELEPAADGTTVLHFAHHGLPQLDCYDMCQKGWDFYVGKSLPALLVDGVGSPGLRGASEAAAG